MASFSGPKLSNRIADDVPDMQAMLSSLAKLTPDSGNTDYPIGTKRVAETTNGYEFQQYNGTGWVTLEKWNIDAQKVDGHSACTGTTANTIPVRNADKKLPGDITGNAATATSAQSLSEINPIGKGGTGADNVESARANLGVAPISHASSTTTHGAGDTTQYGHLRSSDTPDATRTAATGDAFSPAGAAALETSLTERVDGVAGDVQSLETTLRTLIAEEVAKYLPLAGGTMGGGILFDPAEQSGINVIRSASHATGYLQFCGGMAYASGASLALYGLEHSTNPGAFLLNAHGDGVRSLLVGRPNGQFTWAGQNIARTVNGSSADTNGDVRVWAESNTDVNLNNITTDGTYYVSGDNINIPSGSNGYLEVYATSSGSAVRQVFYRIGTVNSNEHNVYTRARNASGTWGSWIKILTSKDTTGYITTQWNSGASWYRKWSNGWIEQGGLFTHTGTWATVSLNTSFTATNYTIVTGSIQYSDDGNGYAVIRASNKTKTSFQCADKWDLGQYKKGKMYWYACGY